MDSEYNAYIQTLIQFTKVVCKSEFIVEILVEKSPKIYMAVLLTIKERDRLLLVELKSKERKNFLQDEQGRKEGK